MNSKNPAFLRGFHCHLQSVICNLLGAPFIERPSLDEWETTKADPRLLGLSTLHFCFFPAFSYQLIALSTPQEPKYVPRSDNLNAEGLLQFRSSL
jgi:hypothetical protein